jgi:hypothetical protein
MSFCPTHILCCFGHFEFLNTELDNEFTSTYVHTRAQINSDAENFRPKRDRCYDLKYTFAKKLARILPFFLLK